MLDHLSFADFHPPLCVLHRRHLSLQRRSKSNGWTLTFLNVIIYVIGLCLMVYTVNIRLIQMMLITTTNHHNANHREPPSIGSRNDFKLLQTVTKLTVLQTMFTITAISYVITSVLHHFVFQNDISLIMDWLIYALTIQTGTLCIYLTFNFNDREYVICRGCNRCCTEFCKWFIEELYGSAIMMNRIESLR